MAKMGAMDSELFERRATRASMAKGLALTLAMTAVGLYVLSIAHGRPVRTLLGLFLTAVGGVGVLGFAWWTARPPVGLRLSAKGIKMGSPVGGSFQDLPWTQVRAVRVAPYNGKPVVAIDPVDPEWGMEGLKEHPLRIRNDQRAALGSWMFLHPGAFGMTPEALASEIERFHERFRSGAPPTYPRP